MLRHYCRRYAYLYYATLLRLCRHAATLRHIAIDYTPYADDTAIDTQDYAVMALCH